MLPFSHANSKKKKLSNYIERRTNMTDIILFIDVISDATKLSYISCNNALDVLFVCKT
jgi:hypothetical protein